jgi:hypothetical protein
MLYIEADSGNKGIIPSITAGQWFLMKMASTMLSIHRRNSSAAAQSSRVMPRRENIAVQRCRALSRGHDQAKTLPHHTFIHSVSKSPRWAKENKKEGVSI